MNKIAFKLSALLLCMFVLVSCHKDDDDIVSVDGWELHSNLKHSKHNDHYTYWCEAYLEDGHTGQRVEEGVFYQVFFSYDEENWERIDSGSGDSANSRKECKFRDEPYNVYFYVLAIYDNIDIEGNTLSATVPTHKE
ncbi:MAG: hypothetical protein MJ211_04020 [Bacteroidales bacterium]|nr:hypothetical protein [Bacteroidales bacterium]